MSKQQFIPNQVFIGCPWRTVRPKYEKVIDDLKKKFPLSFKIIGRGGDQDAKELLTVIKDSIISSSYAIFDATAGNANVSLEYGFAEAKAIPMALYLGTHGASKKIVQDAPIIQDLAGKVRNQYSQINGLKKLLSDFSAQHIYTKRFEQFLRDRRLSKGKKRRARTLALKVIHCLDGRKTTRRAQIAQDLQVGIPRYKENEINNMITDLHKADLVKSGKGPFANVLVT